MCFPLFIPSYVGPSLFQCAVRWYGPPFCPSSKDTTFQLEQAVLLLFCV